MRSLLQYLIGSQTHPNQIPSPLPCPQKCPLSHLYLNFEFSLHSSFLFHRISNSLANLAPSSWSIQTQSPLTISLVTVLPGLLNFLTGLPASMQLYCSLPWAQQPEGACWNVRWSCYPSAQIPQGFPTPEGMPAGTLTAASSLPSGLYSIASFTEAFPEHPI